MTSGEHSWELQRRVRRIYSDFEDEQVIEYLDTLVERGLNRSISCVSASAREGPC